MIKHITAFAVLIILPALFCPPVIPAADIKTNQMRIVLDPGHGGKDSGQISPAGLNEASVALELAGMIAGELSDRFDVVLTRKPDEVPDADPIPPEHRVALANQSRADAFISIHLHQARTEIPLIFCFDLPTPGRATQWQAQALTKKTDSQQLATLAANRFQSAQDLRPKILHAPLTIMEGLMMPGIMVEPFSLSQVPADPGTRKTFLAPYARTLAKAVSAFLTRQD